MEVFFFIIIALIQGYPPSLEEDQVMSKSLFDI